MWFPLPFFYDNRVQLKPDLVDFLSLPSPESEHVITKSGASVGSDIEVLFYGAKNRVCAADFKFGMQGKMGHEMSGYIFNARTTTEEYAHERTDNFTVLVTIGFATQS